MKVKVLIAAAVAAVAVLIPATSASAQPNQWYWSAKSMESFLADGGIEESDGSFTAVSYAKCFGDGPRWKGMFKRFDCYIESPRFDPFYITVYVEGKNRASYDFLGFAS